MKTAKAALSIDQTLWGIFLVFLKLGLTSFGGPVAHLGYYRDELVTRRQWLSEQHYAELVALCQFLPGPASSQVGFSLGVLRGNGFWGGVVAWSGFTAPSALLLLAVALGATAFGGPVAQGLIHGLKLVAVAVVAQAVWGMARNLTPDKPRVAIALAATLLVVLSSSTLVQMVAILLGAVAGLWLCRSGQAPAAAPLPFPVTRRSAVVALIGFALLLLGLPLIATATTHQGIALFDAFYRAGALVFGGGHVVLPLLQAEVVIPGWVTRETFVAGYGLAQAVPGPLFTFAAYLGAVTVPEPNGLAGAAIALVAIFLPGLLLVYGMLPFWDHLRSRTAAQAAMRGANAAVVGILAAALYDPVWTTTVLSPRDLALAFGGFLLLTVWKFPPWTVVAALGLAGAILAMS